MVNRYSRTNLIRVRCQFCNIINYTKNLHMELVCTQSCNKYAKYRFQELKIVRVHDKSNRKFVDVYEVVRQSKPCPDCGNLTPTNQLIKGCCISCSSEDLPEAVLA